MAHTAEYFEFLDDLRKSGEINMYAAAPYLQEYFGLSVLTAREICKKWRDTFNDMQTPAERAAQVRG